MDCLPAKPAKRRPALGLNIALGRALGTFVPCGFDFSRLNLFWVKIWEASIALTDHLIHMGLGTEKEILEVGAGMGVTGLFLAAFGQNISHLRCGPDAGCLMLDA